MSSMRKLIMFMLLWLPLVALGQSFQEGVHYQSLPTPVPTSSDDQIEVVGFEVGDRTVDVADGLDFVAFTP